MRIVLILCLAWTWGANVASAATLRNYIAAIVNDSIITRQEVEQYTEKSVDVLKRTYYDRPEILFQKRAEAFDEGLQQLLERKLILDDFKASGLVLPESFVDNEIKDRLRERFNNDRVRLTQTLHADGLTYEAFRQRIREELIVRIMLQRNLQSAKLISPAKIQRYYQEHLDEFKVGEQIKLRMIALGRASGATTKEIQNLAQEIYAKIQQGASFVEMAALSEGSQRRQDGDWGWTEQKELNRGLADVAFALKPGQVSGVLARASDPTDGYWLYRYENGQLVSGRKYTSKEAFVEEKKFDPGTEPPVEPQEFYIMLVEDRRTPRTKDLIEVQEQIEKDLLVREHERLRKRWIDRLKEKAYVRYF